MDVKQFRNKPVNLTAIQYDGTLERAMEIIATLYSIGGLAMLECFDNLCSGVTMPHRLKVHTSTGVKVVPDGSWVVRDEQGQFQVMSHSEISTDFEEVVS